jgi:hypothetical protein
MRRLMRDQPSIEGKLTQVRTAYRLLHAYHRRLFNLLTLTRDAVESRFGPLLGAWWGPVGFDPVPRKKADPTTKWVFDFIPLGRASFCWASAKKPEPGSFHFAIWHYGDSGLEEASSSGEPEPAQFPPPEECRTILYVYVKVLVGVKGADEIDDWERVDKPISVAPGYDESQWHDGLVHLIRLPEPGGVKVRFGGFVLNVAEVADRQAIEERLIRPLLLLIEQAKTF